MAGDVVQIEYDSIIHDTDLSILFSICDEEVWIPLSQIDEHNVDDKWFSIHEWLAMEKGLI